MNNDLLYQVLKEEMLKITQIIDLLQLHKEHGFCLYSQSTGAIFLMPFKYCFLDNDNETILFTYNTHTTSIQIKRIVKIVVESSVPTIHLKENK